MENEGINELRPQRNGFLEFLRKVWSAKITLGISFAATAILVGVALGAVVNPMRATYQTEVVYQFTGASSGRFADGTSYNYLNNVSYDNLLIAKNSDPSFTSIDITSMSGSGAITVEIVNETAEDGKTTIKNPAHLLYSAKQKYFKSYAQARSFLDALAEIPTSKAASIAANMKYNHSLEESKTALSYDSQVRYLRNQYNLINDGYASILADFGNAVTYSSESGASVLVSDAYLDFKSFFAVYSVSTLQEVLESNGFVKEGNIAAKSEAEARIAEIDRIIAKNTAEINALTAKYEEIYKGGSTTGASPFAERIQALITENTALTQEREYQTKRLDWISGDRTPEEIKMEEDFQDLLFEITAGLTLFVDEYTTVRHDVSAKLITTTYANSSHTVSSGAFAWYICAIAAVAVGAIVGVTIAYFKGASNLEKALNKEKAA